jgi:ribosomal protein L11 methyltransferase
LNLELQAEAGLAQTQPPGWFYRLSPDLVLRTRGDPGKAPTWEKALLVRSGEAFHPGHPTTRLCLDLLREALAAAPVHRLLDLGCGAGVLCLAAAALGIPRVLGVDISGKAAWATRENARQNDFEEAIRVVQGSSEALKGPFDLVLANLHTEVQLAKAAELHRLAAASGRLILSGFHDNEETLVLAGYRQRGWAVKRRLVKEFRHPELPPHLSFTWVACLLAPEKISPD